MYGYTVFHEDIINSLIRSVREGRSANAYIFEGDKKLGVMNAAELFAKTLMCLETDSAPCGKCGPCEEMETGADPDLIRVTKPKDRASLGIDTARSIINSALTKPIYSRRKVFLIEDGDLMTAEAQNSLLKMLEEPPEYAVFIIVCESEDNILETVRSRSVTIEFPPVGDDVVKRYIEEKYPNEPRTDFLVKYCAGLPMTADDIINNEELETERGDAAELLKLLVSRNKADAFKFADYFDKHKDNAAEICDMLMMYLRDALVENLCGGGMINADKGEEIRAVSVSRTAAELAAALDEVVIMKKMIGRYVKTSAAALHAALRCG